MSDVNTWDPTAGNAPSALQLDCVRRAAAGLDKPNFGLDDGELRTLAPLMSLDAERWTEAARDEDVEELVAWIRFFTLAEARLSGFESGARSPVIPLARALRERGAYPGDLTTWIKAHSDNRFLPHGSLMDRL